jgi:uncharacterized membrane protein
MSSKTQVTKTKLERFLPWLLIIGGTIGLIAAFMIMFEKLALLDNPSYQLACDINPIISCGSVMQSDQANAFGFPNPFIGLVAFPILITIGAAMKAGAAFKRWFWIGLQLGVVFGLGFVLWLFYQTVYNINALCPYCMVVWAVVIPIFWYVTLYNLRNSHVRLPQSLSSLISFLQRHHLDVLLLTYVIMATLIIKHFWYYFGTLV